MKKVGIVLSVMILPSSAGICQAENDSIWGVRCSQGALGG